ncbi:uncharacterized protein LOC125855893 [Solanum stenotomum]|uniref:uncharacterized protein LOC125855893 n=1 Tax=Solanum stenotomum TaxID=172797 RepID=UPI0020CFEF48|nr:uncharacterized protein LOC125855893 [Solanum stenotomum]
MPLMFHNCNGKIWLFVNHGFIATLISDTEQQLSLNLCSQTLGISFLVTTVYAKCDKNLRMDLWDDILSLSNGISRPWILGDFNAVLNGVEKIGGIPVVAVDVEDFNNCVEACDVLQIQYKEHEDFKEVVRRGWDSSFTNNRFLDYKRKIKQVKKALTIWSRQTYEDIFQQLLIREEIAKLKEKLFEEFPSQENRAVMQKAKADIVKGRRNRLKVTRILNEQGCWVEEEDQIVNEAIDYYQKQFTQERDASNFPLLHHIPELVTEEDNAVLGAIPDEPEIRKAVFSLNGDSACGPDGLSGRFFHSCWDIVGVEVGRMVVEFFAGNTLPKSITHTNLVLIPKKDNVQSFSDLRPISLSNFVNKILSRIVHDRLENILPKLISPNQSNFVKGRNIIENVFLTQESVADIGKRGKPSNVILKLDMAKAYDRVSWFF